MKTGKNYNFSHEEEFIFQKNDIPHDDIISSAHSLSFIKENPMFKLRCIQKDRASLPGITARNSSIFGIGIFICLVSFFAGAFYLKIQSSSLLNISFVAAVLILFFVYKKYISNNKKMFSQENISSILWFKNNQEYMDIYLSGITSEDIITAEFARMISGRKYLLSLLFNISLIIFLFGLMCFIILGKSSIHKGDPAGIEIPPIAFIFFLAILDLIRYYKYIFIKQQMTKFRQRIKEMQERYKLGYLSVSLSFSMVRLMFLAVMMWMLSIVLVIVSLTPFILKLFLLIILLIIFDTIIKKKNSNYIDKKINESVKEYELLFKDGITKILEQEKNVY